MVVLRFLVAMGVGGEWAVASAMVAEVMPARSRPVMSSIFHASSVGGTLMAAAAGAYIVGNPELGESAWRWGFAIGAVELEPSGVVPAQPLRMRQERTSP